MRTSYLPVQVHGHLSLSTRRRAFELHR
ncbi:hypothetical protein ACFW04_004874 [Cataglyphis niger]